MVGESDSGATRVERLEQRPATRPLSVVGIAVIIAFAAGVAAHLLHLGEHAVHASVLHEAAHLLRDSALAVPVAVIVVLAVSRLVRRWNSRRPVLFRIGFGLLVGLGYSVTLVPGGLAHSFLFPLEATGGLDLRHAISDAAALLPMSVYSALGATLVLGAPREPVLPLANFARRLGPVALSVRRRIVSGRPVRLAVALLVLVGIVPVASVASALVPAPSGEFLATNANGCVTADVVALDQPFYYNRLGAINANGMIYALARDVVEKKVDGTLTPLPDDRSDLAGKVQLRPDKRPRPLTLRVNEGDCLEISFTNLLDPVGFIFSLPGDFPTGKVLGLGVPINGQIDDQPVTRLASIHVDGLSVADDIGSDGSDVGQNGEAGDGLVAPGHSTTYTLEAGEKGTHLMYSMGSTIGGEGNGGQRPYGLFGAVNVEPDGSTWYRSQLTRQEMDWATTGYTDQGHPIIDYNAVYPAAAGPGKAGLPIIRIQDGAEIVHSDLNAIIDDRGYGYPDNAAYPTRGMEPFREFTVIFHDEATGVQAFPAFYNDPVLEHTLHGVSDSFPINYGSGGIGSEIIANRLGVGPMWDCSECKYEEFFLTSFTVGDPAMIVDIPANTTDGRGNIIPGAKATKALYPDDPSNVHHSYLGDRVVYRNLHAGPKEHHIFHLHAHQWQANPDDPQSAYLDGQALGPGSGYSYEVAYGGSGNRNLTVGDSIFHCHFYPHFAQGMWELWRVHDTFEQGTELGTDGKPVDGARALPDGEITAGTPIPGLVPMPGIAMAPMPAPEATVVAHDLNDDGIDDSSQFDANGDGVADIDQGFEAFASESGGTPNVDTDGDGEADIFVDLENPGYPWFTPGLVGHRPPTPALDLLDDGGLPRHVITSGPEEDNPSHPGAPVEMYVSRLDFNKVLREASGQQIPEHGTAVEQIAMAFHAGDGDAFLDTYIPEVGVAPTVSGGGPDEEGFEVNGLPAAAGAPFADPCREDAVWNQAVESIDQNRTIKGANIEMPIVLNKVGWHFQQQRFETLWEDVIPTLAKQRAPQPMVMRLNSTDCADFHHTNLVPNVYQLDDYQVRTPTDIIGQHIHLVKFDVMSADGAANGWNYEDGTLSPDEVRERIEAFNNGGGLLELDGTTTRDLEPQAHPFFGAAGPNGQDWTGARTTIQRWYADPLLERSWDGGVGTVFTHDHYGPSTHQQVGLYSTVLVEPEGSRWLHNETGLELGTRGDGGPAAWQAIIVPGGEPGDADFEAHREFYFEFADFQHAYESGGGKLGTDSNENLLGDSVTIPSYSDFDDAINPSYRQAAPDREDIYLHPNACPGGVPRPCPEAISADDPGTYVLNMRNEPIGLRVFNGRSGNAAGQTSGEAGDLAFAYQTRTDRAIGELNVQPEGNGISPYPALTADIRPGDPWTPTMRVYMGDKVRIRVQVGAHEEEHNFTIPGLKWLQETNSPNSGWRNFEFFGIDEYFNLDVPILPDVGAGSPNEVDYVYTMGAEVEGTWNGVWGLLRSYGKKRSDLVEIPGSQVGDGYFITNDADYTGICPVAEALDPVTYRVTAVQAKQVLNNLGLPRQPGEPEGWLVYNDRNAALRAPAGGTAGSGPLVDPTALMYVMSEDLILDNRGTPIGMLPGTPVEPLVLRAAAGDCIEVELTNALPRQLASTEMPGFNSLPPIVHKDENADRARGITTFNANDLTPSSYVGMTPQLLSFDARDAGMNAGLTEGKLAAPGEKVKYRWYAGQITSTKTGVIDGKSQFVLNHTPVEFGAAGIMPADIIKGTENGLVGAIVIEPAGSTWAEDPDTRTQATVTKADGTSFRDFVVVLQNDINLRYSGGSCSDARNLATLECAVPALAAEGPLGPPEDPQDSGQKAINYGADPLWYRLGITPDTPFGEIHRDGGLKDKIARVFSNSIVGEDPQVPVFRASPNGPGEGRFRVVMPGGHARGITWTLHGHEWQKQPYTNNSTTIGYSPTSQYYGAQEGVNPAGHWDFVVELGGSSGKRGDYLFRDQASFGSYQGLWGILRYDETRPIAIDDAYETSYGTPLMTEPPEGVLSNDWDLDGGTLTATATDQPANGTLAWNPANDGAFTYTPNEGFVGIDSFTYRASDGDGMSNLATVTVTVTAPDLAAVDDAYETVVDTQLVVPAPGVLGNDVGAGEGLAASVGTLPVSGTLEFALDGSFTYAPNAGFVGVDAFTYQFGDAATQSNFATVTITVAPPATGGDVTITKAEFRTRQVRWQLEGTVAPVTDTATVFLCDDPLCATMVEIGVATTAADGTWVLNATVEATLAPDPDDLVIAVSSSEFRSDPFPVRIR